MPADHRPLPAALAELILAMARRATTPKECGAVGLAAADLAKTADHATLDVLEEAHRIDRRKLDGYLKRRVVPINRRTRLEAPDA